MAEHGETIIGIDLGTTNSAVAVVEDGMPIVLGNDAGERIIPSAIFAQSADEAIVGSAAKRAGTANPANLITSTKRLMGLTASDLGSDNDSSHSNVSTQGQQVIHRTQHQSFTPVEVSAEILKQLKATAEFRLEKPVQKAVITVPAYFNHSQREATLEAAELAGLSVERLLNEPTAAALSYGLDKVKDKQTVVVFDLGGGTFDLSILELNDGVFHVLGTSGDTQLGGDDVDQLVVNWVLKSCQLDPDTLTHHQHQRILEAAQKAKCTLSDQEEAAIQIPFFEHKEVANIELSLTRNTFDQLLEPILQKLRSICLRALSDIELELSSIDSIILVGGSTRIPAVRQLCETVFKQKPNLSENPDESIAVGAAIQAGILSGSLKKVLLLDVTPLSLGIETYGGLMNVLIPRNTTIPCKAGEMFTNSVANQKSMAVRVMQGERELAKDNWQIGAFELEFEPQPKGQARVGIQFSINENGVLEVLGRDMANEQDTLYQVDDIAVNVADEDVEQMLEESVEHAFEDMNARRLTEVQFKSKELAESLETVITHYQELMTAEEKETLPKLLEELRTQLQSDDFKQLKRLNEQIDQHTQSIASRIVESL